MREDVSRLTTLPRWLRWLFLLIAVLVGLVVLQHAFWVLWHVLRLAQLSWHALADERCVVLGGPWGVEHHWPHRSWDYGKLHFEFCSVTDFPRGALQRNVVLVPRWAGGLLPAAALLAVAVDAARVWRFAGRSYLRIAARAGVITALAALVALLPERMSPNLPDELADAETVVRLAPPFQHRGGFAYFAEVPGLEKFGDTAEQSSRSPALLFENNLKLGPAHSEHDAIGKTGGGRFSHWYGHVYFSSNDGQPPDADGRIYWLVLPRR